MKTLKQSYEFACAPPEVFAALTDPAAVKAWAGDDAQTGPNVGDSLLLWGGDVSGKNLEVQPNAKLVQEWSIGNRKKPSRATFELDPVSNGTMLKLTQEGIPDEEFEDIKQGWIDHYYRPIERYLAEKP